MRRLIPDRLPGLWQVLDEVAQEDGIGLLRQPEETVVEGMLTGEAYAVADHVARKDYEHHGPAYGALVFRQALEIARHVPRRDRDTAGQ